METSRQRTARRHTNRIREEPVRKPARPSPQAKPQSQANAWREARSLALRVAAIISFALVAFKFIYGLHYNIDPSMDHAVRDGDLLVYARRSKNYKARDLLLLSFEGTKQVRRVIATAGDTVDITENGLVINGALQQERNITAKTQRYAQGISFPVTLKENEVFVLGDAREGATDSRIYGPVNIRSAHGKVITLVRRRNL
ncbi:MAG: signal peptidase I [Eubacteriaceae bacterium]|nr:signal peptidase I [Eubacteriaceae bacterium]